MFFFEKKIKKKRLNLIVWCEIEKGKKIINYIGLTGVFALLGGFTRRVMGFLNLASLFTGFFMAVLWRFCIGMVGDGCCAVVVLRGCLFCEG